MVAVLGILSVIAFFGFLIALIVQAIKKRTIKTSVIGLIASFALFLVCLALPSTPPSKTEVNDLATKNSNSPSTSADIQATLEPSIAPTPSPTETQTESPTVTPTLEPSPEPTPVPTPVPTPEPTPEPTFDPSTIGTIHLEGKGDDVQKFQLPIDWTYRCIFRSKGKRNVIVKCDGELEINEIGKFEGAFLCPSESAGNDIELEIKSSGPWTADVVPLGFQASADMAGSGMVVSDLFPFDGNYVFDIEHQGQRNFIVRLISDSGTDLVVNEIGNYAGRCKVNVRNAQLGVWVVQGDGDWTIKQAAD